MRLVATRSAETGNILAKAIYNDKGQALLNEGVQLSEKLIKRLNDMGITYIYIQDSRTEDIQYKDLLPDHLRKEAVITIESVFKQIEQDTMMKGSFVIEKASKRLTELIRNLLNEIRNNRDLMAIISDVYTYDHYIFTHSLNVTLYVLAIGMGMKMSPKELETLGLGALLHDVGKMKVSTEILLKPGRLTEEEFLEVKRHPEEGFQILRGVQTIPLLTAHCAYQHHERMNGTGYPRGIKGDDIHEYAKIIAVADVFDAVTSNRVYRQAMLPHEGLEILYAGSGTLFETKIVEAFRHSVAIYPVGMAVELNDGRKGVISRQNIGLSERPVVRILEEHSKVINPYEVNLKNDLTVVIKSCNPNFLND